MARNDQAQLSFADLEFQQQGDQLDPELQAIADFMDQHQELSWSVGQRAETHRS
jgi:hypothetical protein